MVPAASHSRIEAFGRYFQRYADSRHCSQKTTFSPPHQRIVSRLQSDRVLDAYAGGWLSFILLRGLCTHTNRFLGKTSYKRGHMNYTKNPGRFVGLLYVLVSIPGAFAPSMCPAS